MAGAIDPERFPLAARAQADLFDADPDAGFELGLNVILTGMAAIYLQS